MRLRYFTFDFGITGIIWLSIIAIVIGRSKSFRVKLYFQTKDWSFDQVKNSMCLVVWNDFTSVLWL